MFVNPFAESEGHKDVDGYFGEADFFDFVRKEERGKTSVVGNTFVQEFSFGVSTVSFVGKNENTWNFFFGSDGRVYEFGFSVFVHEKDILVK